MGPVVDLEQCARVDRCIALGGREGGVAQKFLNGAQVSTASKQVRGKGVAQRMKGVG